MASKSEHFLDFLQIKANGNARREKFMGFLVQSRNAQTDEPEGEFILINKPDEPFRMQYLDCDGG